MALFPQKLMFCRWLVTLESVQWVLAHPSVYILHVSVQFSHSIVSNSLWPYGLQHARLPCPSAIPRAWPNSCPLSRWYHRTASSSVVPFSSCLQSFSASGSFPASQFFASGGQNTGVSASASVLPTNEYSGLILHISKA